MENCWRDNYSVRKESTSKETRSIATLSTREQKRIGLGLNLRLHDEKPNTKSELQH